MGFRHRPVAIFRVNPVLPFLKVVGNFIFFVADLPFPDGGVIDPKMKLTVRNPSTPAEDLKAIQDEKYDAVFTDDLYARKIVNQAGSGRNFHIAGYNGMTVATDISPKITTVNSNLTAAGQVAVDYLFEQHKFAKNVVKLEPYLVEGETF